MSRATERFEVSQLPTPVCDVCGYPIEQTDQECVAVDEGVCVP